MPGTAFPAADPPSPHSLGVPQPVAPICALHGPSTAIPPHPPPPAAPASALKQLALALTASTRDAWGQRSGSEQLPEGSLPCPRAGTQVAATASPANLKTARGHNCCGGPQAHRLLPFSHTSSVVGLPLHACAAWLGLIFFVTYLTHQSGT